MTTDEMLAAGRHVISALGGAAVTFGLMSVAQSADAVTAFDHIANGIKEISIGLGTLAPIGMAWWAKFRSSPKAQIAAVAANPDVKQIVLTPAAAPEVIAVATDPAQPKVVVKPD